MIEIHAYQNDDGTYRVEVVDIIKATRTIENKIEIPKADIQITAYKSRNPDSEILTFTVKD